MRRAIALLTALAALGCGTQTLNTRDDIAELIASFTGKTTTVRDRIVRIWQAHDRRDASSWPLRVGEEGQTTLRVVLRDLSKIEETEFASPTDRLRAILFLLDVAEKSESALVRSRTNLALSRIGDPLALDSGPEAKPVTDVTLTRYFELIKQADANLPGKDRAETAERRKLRRAALEELGALRWWPPAAFDRPAAGRQDQLLRSLKWAKTTLEYHFRADRFRADLADPEYGPAAERRLAGLGAEVVRFALCRAALRDPAVEVRFDALGAVEEIGTADLVPPLAAGAGDEPDELVRLRLAQGLGRMGRLDPDASVPALARMLRDLDDDVRHAAYTALREVTGEDHGDRSEAWVTWWSTRSNGGASR